MSKIMPAHCRHPCGLPGRDKQIPEPMPTQRPRKPRLGNPGGFWRQWSAAYRSSICQIEQYVGMARLIKWTPAREVLAVQK